MSKKLSPHKDLIQLLPPLAIDDYQRLKKDIRQNGIRIPIIHNSDGLIIDGYNRYKIAKEIGINPPLQEQKFENEIEAGIQLNLARRHLSVDQKRELIIKLRKRGWTQEKVAEVVGITQQRVDQIEDSSNTNSCITSLPDVRIKVNPKEFPQIMNRLEVGETQEQVAADYGISRRRVGQIAKKEHQQQEAIQKRKEQAAKNNSVIGVHLGDFQKIGSQFITESSVDLIVTDPPYAEGALPLYGAIAEFGKYALKEGGWCLVYAGQSFLPALLNDMNSHLEYGWCFALKHTGGAQRIRKFKLHNDWKPILAFYKPPLEPWWNWLSDFIHGKKEKQYHKWQQGQSEAEYLIKNLSVEGSVICDPCCGTGTVLLAAKTLNRQWIGFEVNEDTAALAQSRLRE